MTSATRQVRPEPVLESGASKVRVAVISFLFNWPSTGGGIVHTVELVQFLRQAGFETELLFARYQPWDIGALDDTCPINGEALEFTPRDWHLEAIKQRFRAAVDRLSPDGVIITDSWNIKPHLAEALGDYPYILRMQALECLCPLNNLRLLPGPPGAREQFVQCGNTQLEDEAQCRRCVAEWGGYSGKLHQLERDLAGVALPGYASILRNSLRGALAILTLNRSIAELYRDYNNVQVVTWGMDGRRFDVRSPNAMSSTPRVLFCGLPHEPMKGFRHLLSACRRLKQRGIEVRLVVTADAGEADDSFIEYAGWQSQDELPRLYAGADVLVVPSVAQEGLSRTAVEAMAAGCPVIGTRLGGLLDVIEDGHTGLLVEPQDEEALEQAIARLLSDAELRQAMAAAARQRFEQHYRWESIIDRHYRPLLRKRGPVMAAFSPTLPRYVDRGRLRQEVAEFFGLEKDEVESLWRRYDQVHQGLQRVGHTAVRVRMRGSS